jgi:O-antigen/teichoic acid export membrane protein
MVPAAVAIGMVIVYTRLLSPAEFGLYNFGFTATIVMQASFFYALNLGVMRFYPGALRDGTGETFLHTAYRGLAVMMLASIAVAAAAAQALPSEAGMIWLLVPMLVLRAAVAINQAVNRSTTRVVRYNIIECSQAAIGFGLGVLLVVVRGPSAFNALLGLIIGSAVTLLGDIRQFVSPFCAGRYDGRMMRDVLKYSAPLAFAYLLGCSLQYADRFVVGVLAGKRSLGIYAVAVALVERPTTLISAWITTATFPAAVEALERGGPEVGRRQAGHNGAILLGLVVPACVGLALTAHHVSDVLVGAEFREGASQLIPIIAAAALLRNIAAHIVDHSFHMSRRSDLMLASYGMAAAFNLCLDFLLIPRFGMYGAAFASLFSLAFLVLVGGYLANRTFRLWLPLSEVLRILFAASVMAAMLILLPVPQNWVGLVLLIGVGVMTYGLIAVAVDLAGVRAAIQQRLRRGVTVGAG